MSCTGDSLSLASEDLVSGLTVSALPDMLVPVCLCPGISTSVEWDSFTSAVGSVDVVPSASALEKVEDSYQYSPLPQAADALTPRNIPASVAAAACRHWSKAAPSAMAFLWE